MLCLNDLLIRHVCCSGISVWKAKNSSTGSSSTAMVNIQQPKILPDTRVTETRGTETRVAEKGPGKSLRNFGFDTSSILRAMESGFPG